MQDAFHKFCDIVHLACVWLSGLAIAVMSLIIPWGIFTRYVLGTGSQWPEPIAIQLMVLFTFLGAAVAYRAAAHIAVGMLVNALPPAMQRAAGWLVHVLMLVVALFAVAYGTRLCIATWNQVIGQLPWLRVGITYAAVPLGGLATALFVIEHLLYGSQHERAVVIRDRMPDAA